MRREAKETNSAVGQLERVENKTVDNVMRLKDAPSVRATPLMEQLGEDIGILKAATGKY